MTTPDLYATTDFYLAAFLRAAGYPFEGVTFSASDAKKATFHFTAVKEDDVLAYYNGLPASKLTALSLVRSIRETREVLYNYPH